MSCPNRKANSIALRQFFYSATRPDAHADFLKILGYLVKKAIDTPKNLCYNNQRRARVAESADAHVWGACGNPVRVQVPSLAPVRMFIQSIRTFLFPVQTAHASSINPNLLVRVRIIALFWVPPTSAKSYKNSRPDALRTAIVVWTNPRNSGLWLASQKLTQWFILFKATFFHLFRSRYALTIKESKS